MMMKPLHLVAAVSTELGLEAFKINEKDISSVSFCGIFDEIDKNVT
jgi:hypothetical protein